MIKALFNNYFTKQKKTNRVKYLQYKYIILSKELNIKHMNELS